MKASGPISAAREAEILAVARDLVMERGLEGFTIDELARRARCSKPTVYRRWQNKYVLIIQVVGARPKIVQDIDTGSLEGDLRGFLRNILAGQQERGRLFLAIALAMQDIPELAAAWRAFGLAGGKDALKALAERALARGEISLVPNLNLLHSLLPGTFVWRQHVEFEGDPTSFAEEILQSVLLPFFRAAPAGPAASGPQIARRLQTRPAVP